MECNGYRKITLVGGGREEEECDKNKGKGSVSGRERGRQDRWRGQYSSKGK